VFLVQSNEIINVAVLKLHTIRYISGPSAHADTAKMHRVRPVVPFLDSFLVCRQYPHVSQSKTVLYIVFYLHTQACGRSILELLPRSNRLFYIH